MATYDDVIEGLRILSKHMPGSDGDPCAVHAEHDEIYAAGPEPSTMDNLAAGRLEEIGWRYQGDRCWRKFT